MRKRTASGHDGLDSDAADVTIAIASFNTKRFTELAIRTAVGRAGQPVRLVVGDSGSTDGTPRMLERLGRRYVDRFEVAPGGRKHSAWLDHWVDTLDSEFAVFVDSDVELRRRGWLVQLLSEQRRSDAVIVSAERRPEIPSYVDPLGDVVRLVDRPAPCLQLVHLPTLRSLGSSYARRSEAAPELPEGTRMYDVGGWIAAQAEARGYVVSVMPPEFRSAYRHYVGRSWRAHGLRDRLVERVAAARLMRFRVLGW